jgi:hypothetical protein
MVLVIIHWLFDFFSLIMREGNLMLHIDNMSKLVVDPNFMGLGSMMLNESAECAVQRTHPSLCIDTTCRVRSKTNTKDAAIQST